MIGYANFISNFKCHCDTSSFLTLVHSVTNFWCVLIEDCLIGSLYWFTCLISEPAEWILIRFDVVYVHYTETMNRML